MLGIIKICTIALITSLLYSLSSFSFANDGKIDVVIHTKTGEKIFVRTELVLGEKAEKGLSGRDNLPIGEGMLFDMNELYKEWSVEERKKARNSIWMPDMKFSIDILWIDNGEIIHMIESAPVPYKNHVASYAVYGHCDWVLEVNMNFLKSHGIEKGNKVDIFR